MKVIKHNSAQEAQTIIEALDHSPFTRCHAIFLFALLTALIFDYTKPFTIPLVIPSMQAMVLAALVLALVGVETRNLTVDAHGVQRS